jgi:hypothetical protein
MSKRPFSEISLENTQEQEKNQDSNPKRQKIRNDDDDDDPTFDQKSAHEKYQLAIMYHNEKKYKEMVEVFVELVNEGHDEAQFQLGVCYFNGFVVNQNYIEAFDLFLKSAIQENENAQYNLGVCYENGIGVPKNIKTAMKWYLKVAEKGNSECITKLCEYFINLSSKDSHYLSDDDQNAFKWLQKFSTFEENSLLLSDRTFNLAYSLCERDSTFLLPTWDIIKPRTNETQQTRFKTKFNIDLFDHLDQDRNRLIKENNSAFLLVCSTLVSYYTCSDVSFLVLDYLNNQ